MALTIYENKEATVDTKVKIDRRLYKNAAGRIVEEGDPSARFLFCSAGKLVDRAELEAAGGSVEVAEVVVEAEPTVEPEAPKPKPKPKKKKAPAKKKATRKTKRKRGK